MRILNPSFNSTSPRKTDDVFQIPRIIHQTWKDKNIPEQYLGFQKSWHTYLADWEYRLWTDEMNRAFLAEHYDWFLPIYDGYEKPIMRVDAVRYFWMYHFGGLYVDLDFEALKSIEPLLLNQKTVIGLEPKNHLQRAFLQKYGFQHILCNALLASVPKAPFWEFMILQLIKHHKEEDPLAATGPFCLTQAFDLFEDQKSLTLIPPELLYPIYEGHDDETQQNKSEPYGDAYGIHHWSGSWWRTEPKPEPLIEIFLEKFRTYYPKTFMTLKNIKNRVLPTSIPKK